MKKSIEEIKADSNLFIDIQMGKYLSSRNKSEFSSDEEAKLIMDKIIEIYNQEIAADHLRLDNLNEAAKVSWFNSVEIDFEKPQRNSLPVEKSLVDIDKETKEFISFYNNEFYFLPEGAILYLIFAGPALEAYGYPLERFKKIAYGEEPTEIEKDLLGWASDLSRGISMAYHEKNEVKKEKFLDASFYVACEKLDKKTAAKVVEDIYANYEEDFTNYNKNKKSQKLKTKKRKK